MADLVARILPYKDTQDLAFFGLEGDRGWHVFRKQSIAKWWLFCGLYILVRKKLIT